MTWTVTAPDGSLSVKANRPLLAGNTTYIKTTMGGTDNDTTNTDVIRDHFWDVSSTLDGRHRFINSPAYTIAGTPADPVLGDGMGGTSYFKTKTSAEAPDNQDVQAYFRNAADVMQLLGIRSCVLFNLVPNGAAAPTVTVKYSHNATLDVTNMTSALSREFTVSFPAALPSVNYSVLGGCVSTSGTAFFDINVSAGATVSAVKTINSVKMNALARSSTSGVPLQIWVVCFGG